MRIRSLLNGVAVVDYDGSGVLNDELKLRFKDIRIKELAPSP
jgi:hypothetical protein